MKSSISTIISASLLSIFCSTAIAQEAPANEAESKEITEKEAPANIADANKADAKKPPTKAITAQKKPTRARNHSVGISVGSSNAEYKKSNNDGNGVSQILFFYNYKLFKYVSVELAYNTGNENGTVNCREYYDGSWSCYNYNQQLFDLAANEFELDAAIIALKGNVPLSQRNSLYGKVGAQYYDYDFRRNDRFVEGDKDLGAIFEAGWQYQWDLGIGMNAGMTYQHLGELRLTSVNVGINYAF